MRIKRFSKIILGIFIITALCNVFGIGINSEDPPLIVNNAYIANSFIL